MSRKGASLSIPGVDKVEVYRAYTTHNPIQKNGKNQKKTLAKRGFIL